MCNVYHISSTTKFITSSRIIYNFAFIIQIAWNKSKMSWAIKTAIGHHNDKNNRENCHSNCLEGDFQKLMQLISVTRNRKDRHYGEYHFIPLLKVPGNGLLDPILLLHPLSLGARRWKLNRDRIRQAERPIFPLELQPKREKNSASQDGWISNWCSAREVSERTSSTRRGDANFLSVTT